MLSRGVAHDGLVVSTDHQTHGRGQRGNSWQANPGANLTFSVVYKPAFLAVGNQFYLNMIASLAIADVLQQNILQPVLIKWPNDIYAHSKKLAGILIENTIKGALLQHTIIGIGVNVNQEVFEHPQASSLRQLTNQRFELTEVLGQLLSRLEKYYLDLKQEKWRQLKQRYLEKLMWLNEVRQFEANGQKIEGVITGVNDWGQLMMRVGAEHKAFNLKEVAYIM